MKEKGGWSACIRSYPEPMAKKIDRSCAPLLYKLGHAWLPLRHWKMSEQSKCTLSKATCWGCAPRSSSKRGGPIVQGWLGRTAWCQAEWLAWHFSRCQTCHTSYFHRFCGTTHQFSRIYLTSLAFPFSTTSLLSLFDMASLLLDHPSLCLSLPFHFGTHISFNGESLLSDISSNWHFL